MEDSTRRGALLLAIASLMMGVPTLQGAEAAAGAAAEPEAGLLPLPEAGEAFYYHNADTEGWPRERVVWFPGAGEAVHRDGTRRPVLVMEVVQPSDGAARHGSGAALLEDTTATRWQVAFDAASLHRVVDTRLSEGAWRSDALFPGSPLKWVDHHAGARGTWYDDGVPEPWSLLWGRHVGIPSLAWGRVVGTGGIGHGAGWGGHQIAGLPLGDGEGVHAERSSRWQPPGFVSLTLELLGEDGGGEESAFHYGAMYVERGVRTEVELWLSSAFALPLRQRTLTDGPHGRSISEMVLVEHAAGRARLPWGLAGGEQVFVPAAAPLGADGPADGDAGLSYPLSEAVAAVRADPALLRLQDMQRRGDAVLVSAFFDQRPGGDPWEPLPEARWLLAFHDAEGDEVAVESKLLLVAGGVPSHRELRNGGAGAGAPMATGIGAVTPQEVPATMPALGDALRAWTVVNDTPEHAPNTVVYSLTRLEDGRVLPMLWSGWWEEGDGAPWLAPEPLVDPQPTLRLHLLGLDQDGGPRSLTSSESYGGIGLVPGLAASLPDSWERLGHAWGRPATTVEDGETPHREAPVAWVAVTMAGVLVALGLLASARRG